MFCARAASGFAIGLIAGTATAWLTELDPTQDKGRASLVATSSNFFGLTAGSLLAGFLAQYQPRPLQLPFVIYLGLLLALALVVARMQETLPRRRSQLGVALSFAPRLGLPRAIRRAFIAQAIAVFGAMAVVGFYAALIPSILAENLHEGSHAVAGSVVAELTLIVAVTVIGTRRLSSRAGMIRGLALLPPALALLVLAQVLGSIAILLFGTFVGGVAAALGYRGSLQVVTEIAPEERRAEVVSSYFVAGFLGNALPVIGVGVLTVLADPLMATLVFAVAIAAFAALALILGRRSINAH